MTTHDKVPTRVYERITHWAERDEATGCLVSKYSTGSHGYAQIGWHEAGSRTVTLCHLALWRYEEGPIPDGYTVDHECKNKRCVERSHLRLLTNHENARRTHGRDWPLGYCVNGHPNSELSYQGKKRVCRICRREWARRYYARRRDGLVGTNR